MLQLHARGCLDMLHATSSQSWLSAVSMLQAEEAARRAEQQAAEAAKRAAEREERLRRAAQYQEPDWVKAAEAAQQDEYETEVREALRSKKR